MRTASIGPLLLAASLLIACGEDDKKKKNDTSDTNTAPTSHPLVPEEYQDIWDWDASGCEAGKSALYHMAEGYSVQETIDGEDAMVIYLSEYWYWFHGEDDFEGDCVDQFDYRGVSTRYAWGGSDPCGTCEEEYWGNYAIVDDTENGCNYGYDGIIVTGDEAGSENEYDTMVFKFDTLTIAGEPNEDNALLVYNALLWDGYWYFDSSYGKGTILPDTDGDYGGPSQYKWVNLTVMCI